MSSPVDRRRQSAHHRDLQARHQSRSWPRCWCRTALPSPTPRLPPEVQRHRRRRCKKNSPDILMVVHLSRRTNRCDQLYLSQLCHTPGQATCWPGSTGVGDVSVFGAREYAMRVWLDPDKVAARDLTAGDVVAALQAQNVQVAAGVLGQPPVPKPGAFQINVQTQGRLSTPRNSATSSSRATPTAGSPACATSAGSNWARRTTAPTAISTASRRCPWWSSSCRARTRWRPPTGAARPMDELSKGFPPGVEYTIVYNPTEFIAESVHEVYQDHLRGGRAGRRRGHRVPADLAGLGHSRSWPFRCR